MILGEVIGAYQKEKKLDVRELAKQMGIRSHSTLWRFISGKPCDADTLCLILLWALGPYETETKPCQPIEKQTRSLPTY